MEFTNLLVLNRLLHYDQKKQSEMMGKFIVLHADRKFSKEEQIEQVANNFSRAFFFLG